MNRLLATVLAVLALSGCGPVTSGIVTNKKHEPAHDVQRSRPIYEQRCGYKYRFGMDGKYAYRYGCDQEYVRDEHYTERVPECWRLRFEDDEGRKGTACVSKSEYDEQYVGGKYWGEE